MEMSWSADIGNDPERDYDLCIELYEDDHHRATLYRGESRRLVLKVFPGQEAFEVPGAWLRDIIDGAEKDLP